MMRLTVTNALGLSRAKRTHALGLSWALVYEVLRLLERVSVSVSVIKTKKKKKKNRRIPPPPPNI